MLIQVRTDRNITGGEKLAVRVEDIVKAGLSRFTRQITRVEVHLSDENGPKHNGDDKKCVLEARPAGLPPVAVTHVGATLDQAVDGAVGRMERLLDAHFGKLDAAKKHPGPEPKRPE